MDGSDRGVTRPLVNESLFSQASLTSSHHTFFHVFSPLHFVLKKWNIHYGQQTMMCQAQTGIIIGLIWINYVIRLLGASL